MIINIQDDILKIQALSLLDRILVDKTTKKNIMWATDAYDALGMKYERNDEITSDLITGHHASVIKTHARKAMEQQTERTRQRAEVLVKDGRLKMTLPDKPRSKNQKYIHT